MEDVDYKDINQSNGDDRHKQPQVKANFLFDPIANPASKHVPTFGILKDVGAKIWNAEKTDNALDDKKADIERQGL